MRALLEVITAPDALLDDDRFVARSWPPVANGVGVGGIASGDLADVGPCAGVSTSTVSVSSQRNGPAVASDRGPGSPCRRRPRLLAAPLGSPPGRRAHRAIAVVVPDLTNPFFATIARGLQHRAHENGELTVIADAEDTVRRPNWS